MNGTRPLFFIALGLFGLYAVEFGVLMALRVPSALLHPVFFSVAFAAAVSLYPPQRAAHATSMAFLCTTLGLVLGVPLATWIEAVVSCEATFYFCAAVNLAELAEYVLPEFPVGTVGAARPSTQAARS